MSVSTQVHSQEMVEFDQKKLELIRNTFCKDATELEYQVFIEVCKHTRLDPVIKQIYFIKRGGKPTHQTSIDGLRLIADRTKRYVPGREPTFTYDKQGALFSATSYVKKLASDGTWHEVAATAIFSEYNPNQGQWGKMPHVMLAKCAEALALRRAFPADMAGVYSQEEMDQADDEDKPKKKEQPKTTTLAGACEEVISTEEALEIESLLAAEDKQYRDDILAYYTKQRKLESNMTGFIGFPKRYLAGLMKSIGKRKEERAKREEKEIESIDQVVEEIF